MASAANTSPDPTAILRALVDRIYSIGETTGNVGEMIAAEAKAGDEVRRYIASGETEGLLAAGTDKARPSPLMTAAYMGYPNVVAALLTSPLVKAHMNDPDDMGLTPWIAATFAMRQSLWVCKPAVFANPYGFVPMLVTQPYYLLNPKPPYNTTRMVLENAGAPSNESQAKEVWLKVCKGAFEQAKEAVQTSSDLQTTLQKLGATDLTVQLRKFQNLTADAQRK